MRIVNGNISRQRRLCAFAGENFFAFQIVIGNAMRVRLEIFFKALADRTRLRLINLMQDEEVCVCACVAVLNANQPKISRHLAYLKRAGLVAGRRDGKWTHYRLVEPADPYAAKILHELRDSLAHNPDMQNDKARWANHVANAAPLSQDAHQTATVNR